MFTLYGTILTLLMKKDAHNTTNFTKQLIKMMEITLTEHTRTLNVGTQKCYNMNGLRLMHALQNCSTVFCIKDKKNELPHDKTNKMTVRPAKTQISLGICPV